VTPDPEDLLKALDLSAEEAAMIKEMQSAEAAFKRDTRIFIAGFEAGVSSVIKAMSNLDSSQPDT